MKLTIDFETRSTVDITKRGAYVYAEDPSTEVLMLAVKVDDQFPKLWIPPKFKNLKPTELTAGELEALIENASEIHAHNANFERVIWKNKMEKYGFAPLPLLKMRCTAALARYHALPGSLEKAGEALRLEIKKDKVGHALMMKMCKPKKDGTWHEPQDDFLRLCEYCRQDVNAEKAICDYLGSLPLIEQETWILDQIINDRGIPVDVEGAKKIISIVKTHEEKLLQSLQEITEGKLNSTRQHAKTLSWLKKNGVELDNLQKQTVTDILAGDNLPPNVRRLLDVRQSLAKSSVAKLDAVVRYACADNRMRGTLLYHSATTGRWGGRGFQPQNLPRESYEEKEIEDFLNTDPEMIEVLYDCPMKAASRCIRGMIYSLCNLMAADFSAIEARVLAWLAGEEKIVQAYFAGIDTYKLNAVDIYGTKYENVSKDQRQIGKVAELSLGYQGWTSAFLGMAKNYGVQMDEDKAAEIIKAWRAARPRTVSYWANVERAAIRAVTVPGSVISYGRVKFLVKSGFLKCLLPSGRCLHYPFPSIGETTTKYGVTKSVVKFWGEDINGKFKEQMTYGGKLTENIVQAIARDLLVEVMKQCQNEELDVVLHVHDEIVLEGRFDKTSKERFEKIAKSVPLWAEGLPMNAEAWIGKRYRK